MRRPTGPARRHLAALMHVCLDDHTAGRWDQALALAGEGLALCEEYGYRFFACKLQFVQALVAVARGDTETNAALAQEIVRWAAPRGAHGAHVLAFHTRGLAALGAGDYEAAYRHAAALSPPGTLPAYLFPTPWPVPWTWWKRRSEPDGPRRPRHMRQRCGNPLFEQALSPAPPGAWPCDDERGQTAARPGPGDVRTAGSGTLGGTNEGRTPRRRPGVRGRPPRPGTLTAQEQEIATLAATGLTDKQIAERLFLTHRTVSTHLYRIYPKLGINSRAALRDALGPVHSG
ncbi:response regulator transcription factor [Streptomyces roseirectus]|uniref:response regulator transcription factor n=1 Tax=Streptomyces roseirectus TaxID=2768066 RepID=UPI001FE556E3|nr:helix-turn-helix transcriptional regulator [Streptomyces roseirectus]